MKQHRPKPGETDLRGFEWHYLNRHFHSEALVIKLESRTVFRGGIAFSPDGKRIAGTAGDKIVNVWDAQTGKELLTLKGQKDTIRHVIFSPAGRNLVTASSDNTVCVWDAETGTELLTKKASSWISSLAFNADTKRLIVATSDWRNPPPVTKVEDSQTGTEFLTVKDFSEPVLSPDGKRVVGLLTESTGLKEYLTHRPVKNCSLSRRRAKTGSEEDSALVQTENDWLRLSRPEETPLREIPVSGFGSESVGHPSNKEIICPPGDYRETTGGHRLQPRR